MIRPIATLTAVLLGLAVSLPGLAQSERKDMVLKGDAQCTRCHDETEEYPVLAIGKTKHGTIADGRTPTCTSCHGESPTHANKPADAVERPKPDRMFGKASKTPVALRNDACLNCHQGGNRIHWQSSTHATSDVACSTCHQVHAAHDKARDKITQTDVCFSCHKDKRVQVNKPSRHAVLEGKVACSDCHNPHGNNPKQLIKASVVETCWQCHLEKRGPFVHNHQPVTEDCTICHNPHGSTISPLLKARAPFLCQDCHGTTGHRAQAAGVPIARSGSSSVVGTIGRGCLNCHTNIHGSNSSQDSGTVGRFRR